MLDANDYTVGWVCAVNYTLGRIGKHNIVIATLPHWQYGLVSAASVARDMIRSFPNVRIGLMVGIGGGAPSPRHDIRLGDVVVSSPGYGNGGVLQYDYGKTVQCAQFEMTGYLNEPPQLFLTALAQLKAQYRRKGHEIDKTVQRICEKNPRLRSDFGQPDRTTDRLYLQSYTHQGGGECAIGCSEGSLVVREPRAETDNNPAIHYGLIASANQLMNDALLRDKLSAESLCKIAPNKVTAERRLGEILSNVQGDLEQVKSGVESLKAEARFEHISKWLSPPDPTTNLNNTLSSRHPGSGKWLLQQAAYVDWKSERNSFLWLYGIPGCGKTVLSSTVVEDVMKDPTSKIIYFYFDFNDDSKQKFDMMLRSLISQLYDNCTDSRNRLDSLYTSCNHRKKQPSPDSLRAAFHDMIEQAGDVYIVLDALDECPRRNEYPGGLLSWIRDLHHPYMNIHFLVTSRQEQDIMVDIEKWARDKDIINIQKSSIREDIDAYINARVRKGGELATRWDTWSDIQDKIEATLTKKADGMFRWAACQLDELERCLSRSEVDKALANLPKTLDETYARIMANIPTVHKHMAIRILQFLTFSERPLRSEEVVDCITVDVNASIFNPKDRMPLPREIARYCSSLVVVAERQGSYDAHDKAQAVTEIRLAHFSVKEYLISGRLNEDIAQDLEASAARISLASVCLIYLLNLEHHHSIQRIQQRYPLATYAAQCWTAHVMAINSSASSVRNLIMDLFNRKEKFQVCYYLYPIDIPWSGNQNLYTPPVLYYASFAGLDDVVQRLLDEGADVNASSGQYGNALQAASWRGHEKIVQILLDKGADVNAQGGEDGNAPYAASWRDHEKIVQMLLDKDADITAEKQDADIIAQSEEYVHALYAASFRGHKKIVEMLLARGADVNARDGLSRPALFVAIRAGHSGIFRLFEPEQQQNTKDLLGINA
ncbi:hypothetical protein GGR57DRAFT_493877 [Xylariaceae sp. FL1272]|nr:hypothetical protein GGR57DRAFT_493877 [Xylariaceae sp. FL1272]